MITAMGTIIGIVFGLYFLLIVNLALDNALFTVSLTGLYILTWVVWISGFGFPLIAEAQPRQSRRELVFRCFCLMVAASILGAINFLVPQLGHEFGPKRIIGQDGTPSHLVMWWEPPMARWVAYEWNESSQVERVALMETSILGEQIDTATFAEREFCHKGNSRLRSWEDCAEWRSPDSESILSSIPWARAMKDKGWEKVATAPPRT